MPSAFVIPSACVFGVGDGQKERKLSVVSNKRRSSVLRRENFKVILYSPDFFPFLIGIRRQYIENNRGKELIVLAAEENTRK